MNTVVTSSVEKAASVIRRGGLVAFPTETVYGLGADATSEKAVQRIFETKGRPADNPLIVHLPDAAQIEDLASDITDSARMIIDRFFPGPITVILISSGRVTPSVSAGLPTLAFRVPSFELTRDFLRSCETPVAAPSANRSGRPSATNVDDVLTDLDGRIECILEGPRAPMGLESTVIDCTSDPPRLLRAGWVTLEALAEVIPEIRIGARHDDGPARSPGMKHRHYAPNARVLVIEHPGDIQAESIRSAYIGVDPPSSTSQFEKIHQSASLDDYAFALYAFFRECDRAGITTIYCQDPGSGNLGRAIRDRIQRAAERA